MWKYWWTRPQNDGFQSDTAYLLGWYRTYIPSGAVGLLSYGNWLEYDGEKPFLKYILATESPRRLLVGHNGVSNGFTAAIYTFPETQSAVIALSNGAGKGDASDWAAKAMMQALFDLKPAVNIVSSAEDFAQKHTRWFEKMVAEWRKNRDISQPEMPISQYVGEYTALTLTLTISQHASPPGLGVIFNGNARSSCRLEHYNKDTYSYLPTNHDDWVGNSFIDWDYYEVGLLRFHRNAAGTVDGLYWRWDEFEEPTFFPKKLDRDVGSSNTVTAGPPPQECGRHPEEHSGSIFYFALCWIVRSFGR